MRCDLSSAMSENLLNTLKKTAVLSRSSGVLARYPGRRCARPPMSQNFIDFCRRRLWSEAALRRQALDEAVDRHGAEILAAARPHGDGAGLQLLVAYDQEIRQLLHAMFADLVANLLVRHVGAGAKLRRTQLFGHLARVRRLALGDGEDHRLHRGQRGRECTGVVLDQDADEALE